MYDDGRYGNSMNYSLLHSIACNGNELSIDECTSYQSPGDSCLPWCPLTNIGLKCFGMKYNNQCECVIDFQYNRFRSV